jgi:hypothetical protein
VIRTPKEWTETCDKCRGTGNVHKRQRFFLWTPDEYLELMPDRDPLKLDVKHDVPADAVVCSVHGGATIFESCREGIELAKLYKRPVVFEFNGAVAICRGDSDPDTVGKAWWKLAYGKTYEESLADH